MVTGRSVTGIFHLLNQTPIYWHSKRQGRVQTATYSSEFMAAGTASEQIIDLRYTLRMMGIPIDGPSWMFGDNQSVITYSQSRNLHLIKGTMHYLITLFVNALPLKSLTLCMSPGKLIQAISSPSS